MEKQIKKVLLSVGVFLIIFLVVGGYFINKYYNKDVINHPEMYCYEYFRGTDKPVSVLIIEDLDLKKQYLKYYQELGKGKEPYLPDDIPLKGLPQYSPVYVMGYTQDSLLAEVVSYYDRGVRLGGSYTRGWVYAKTLHKNPPPKKKKE